MDPTSVDYHAANVPNSTSPPDSGPGASAGGSADSMTSLDSAIASQYSFMEGLGSNYSLPNNVNQDPMMMQPYEEADGGGKLAKINIRRLKNRQSAARSREKVKTRLLVLEKAAHRREAQAAALKNEKGLLLAEIESLEDQLVSLTGKILNNTA